MNMVTKVGVRPMHCSMAELMPLRRIRSCMGLSKLPATRLLMSPVVNTMS